MAGELEHRRLERGRLIDDEIRFLKPFRSRSDVGFAFQPSGSGTEVTWSMNGSLPWFMFWMKGMMEPFIGMDYDRGLKMLKEWIETGEIQAKTVIRGVESIGPLRMAGVRRSCAVREVGESMQEAFGEVHRQFQAHNLPTDGKGISVYHHFDIRGQRFDYTSGFLIPESTSNIPSGLSTWSIPKVNALAVEHQGSYGHLGNSWSAANQYTRYKKLKQSKAGTFEIYRNTPDDTAPADLRTDIYLPLR
ncbi:MAG: GyrI-like domain-containing protein [Planctomycetaceae bacterium]